MTAKEYALGTVSFEASALDPVGVSTNIPDSSAPSEAKSKLGDEILNKAVRINYLVAR